MAWRMSQLECRLVATGRAQAGTRAYSQTWFILRNSILKVYEGSMMATPNCPTSTVLWVVREPSVEDRCWPRNLPMVVLARRASTLHSLRASTGYPRHHIRSERPLVEQGGPAISMDICASIRQPLRMLNPLMENRSQPGQYWSGACYFRRPAAHPLAPAISARTERDLLNDLGQAQTNSGE
jgi:hypothetical protein